MQHRPTGPMSMALMTFTGVCLALAFLAHITAPGACGAADAAPGNIVFILDASGSMGAQIQGKSKMEAAKEALTVEAGKIQNLEAQL